MAGSKATCIWELCKPGIAPANAKPFLQQSIRALQFRSITAQLNYYCWLGRESVCVCVCVCGGGGGGGVSQLL